MAILNFTDKRQLLTSYYTLTSKIKCGLIFCHNLIGALILIPSSAVSAANTKCLTPC